LLTEVHTGVNDNVNSPQPPQFGSTIIWQHQPLSSPDVAGCDKTDGKPFYTVNLAGARSPGYMFFTSSMWVVSRLDVDNGLGAATNRTCYRYEDAMLNGQGRGFQGFKTIVAEEQLPPAAGEPPAPSGHSCGGGGFCSANNLRTTTAFSQEFPLTSRLDTVTVSTLDGNPLSEAKYLWDAQYSTFTTGGLLRVIDVSAVGHVETKYEPGDPTFPASVRPCPSSMRRPASRPRNARSVPAPRRRARATSSSARRER
jgi:hypothetical protein